MTAWVTVWFIGLLPPATNVSLITDVQRLKADGNAVEIMASTTSLGNYLSCANSSSANSLMTTELTLDKSSNKTVYRVVEQVLTLSGTTITSFKPKYRAPIQWMVISSTEGWVQSFHYYNNDHFSVYPTSNALLAYTIPRSSKTGEKYRIYKADRYTVKDRYDFSFKKE